MTYIVLTTGVASSLGVGVYVIAGQVAREQAGPAVVLSFLIAAVTSFLSGRTGVSNKNTGGGPHNFPLLPTSGS